MYLSAQVVETFLGFSRVIRRWLLKDSRSWSDGLRFAALEFVVSRWDVAFLSNSDCWKELRDGKI